MGILLRFEKFRILVKLGLASLGVLLFTGILFHGFVAPHLFPSAVPLIGFEQIQESRQLTAGLVRALAEDPEVQPSRDLFIVAGLSTAREAFDTGPLNSDLGTTRKWVVYGGSGWNVSNVESYISPFFETDITPSTVVLAIHPSHLVSSALDADLEGWPWLREMGRMASHLQGLKILSDLSLRNRKLKNRLAHRLWNFKREWSRKFDIPFDAGAVALSPWRSPPKVYQTPSASSLEIDRQLARWAERGWFTPGNYRANSPQAEILNNMLRKFLQRKSRIIVVLMPESPMLREKIPQDVAAAAIAACLQQVAETPDVALWDFRASLEAEDFHDLAHVNFHGREKFMKQFLSRLRDYEADRRPQASSSIISP